MFKNSWLWYSIIVLSTSLLVVGFAYGNIWLSGFALLLALIGKRSDKYHLKVKKEKIE